MTEFSDQFKQGLRAAEKNRLTLYLDHAQEQYAEAALTLHKAQQALNEWHNR